MLRNYDNATSPLNCGLSALNTKLG